MIATSDEKVTRYLYSMQKSKKVVLVGHAKRGKSEWVNKVIGARPVYSGYIPTQGVEVHPFVRSRTVVKLWDTAGNPKYGGLCDGYYVNADAAIIFADTPEEILYWGMEVLRVVSNATLIALVSDFCITRLLHEYIPLIGVCQILPKETTDGSALLTSL